jgi:hypothetical protein
MPNLTYTLLAQDSETTRRIDQASVVWDAKQVIRRTIDNDDGAVPIPLDLVTLKAIFIETDKRITLTIGTQSFQVEESFWVVGSSFPSTLLVACSDADGAVVDIAIWGETTDLGGGGIGL